MILSLIVAVGKNLEIGLENKMLWHIPEDFKHFKALTLGKTLLMGRKTFESIGKPLPGRDTIVLTRDKSFNCEGITVVHSIKEGVDYSRNKGIEELVVCGGDQIYRQMIELCDILHISEVDFEGEADTFFPNYKKLKFRCISQKDYPIKDGRPSWSYKLYERV